MKLYYYKLEVPFYNKPYMKCVEIECEEKNKAYYPIARIDRQFIRKSIIGTVENNELYLTQKDDEYAKIKFEQSINRKIREHEMDIKLLKENLLALEENWIYEKV